MVTHMAASVDDNAFDSTGISIAVITSLAVCWFIKCCFLFIVVFYFVG